MDIAINVLSLISIKTIVRMDDKIILFCKGADNVIKERLDPKSVELFEESEEHLNVC